MSSAIIELLIHLFTFTVIFIPVFMLLKIYREIKQSDFFKKFLFLIVALVILALPHLGHSLAFFGVNVLPSDPLVYLIFDHIGVILTVISFAYFIFWFDNKYLVMFHSVKKKK